MATALGKESWALVGRSPSPEKPGEPVPATVVMIPAGVILRILWLPVSAT